MCRAVEKFEKTKDAFVTYANEIEHQSQYRRMRAMRDSPRPSGGDLIPKTYSNFMKHYVEYLSIYIYILNNVVEWRKHPTHNSELYWSIKLIESNKSGKK